MSYFDRPEISISDIKAFLKKVKGGNPEPENLEKIFAMGSFSHGIIFEPHITKIELEKENNRRLIEAESKGLAFGIGLLTQEEIDLAFKMKDRFFQDDLCRMMILRPDFQREHAMFKEIEVGGMRYKARIKCDGISKGIKTILEFKGLSVTTEKAFLEAIDNLMYDMAAVQYLLVAECEMILIVGISKINPRLLFKKIIKRHDETYLWGEEKLIQSLKLLHEFSPEDIQMIAA